MNKTWKDGRQSLLTEECAGYFREFPVFDKLLKGFRKKYVSYGSFSGSVVLRGLKEEDREALEGFFQKSFHGQKSVTISAARFKKALADSRFSQTEPKDILESYFQEEMTGRRELREKEKKDWEQILHEEMDGCGTIRGKEWIEDLKETRGEGRNYLWKRYQESRKDTEELRRILRLGVKILDNLPYRKGQVEYLAVFAAMLTGNPHAFDDGTKDGQLLSLVIGWETGRRQEGEEREVLFPALKKQRKYLSVGILRDDISNSVMLCGVRAWRKDGILHEGMAGFFKEGEMLQVPLAALARWERVTCPENELYIVENPSVYAMLCRKWRGSRACMCMNGQPRLSAVLLLDLLRESRVKIYYAGDFDPEGLLIAQKVKQYYKGEFSFWHMSARDYQDAGSGEEISARRLKILERIQDKELLETAREIQKRKKAGYQENIWVRYLEG
ncbi:MAG TPA: DUF2399 domain-containing protein [Candidatus Blautia faecigallinarum]|uniref:DUF2399 domain-containing protein n=1 Tax=Candidatus Blautia faecigallinarum TaxID=2838488 RepID=A0A9D2DT80_9FIRM|nr:DUF2399 domain-containing protein [Candidatus Blautia faecigallinarum]